MSSGVIKGAVGGALFGGVGAIAGASSGKNKGGYTVSIIFKDGTKFSIDLRYYRALKSGRVPIWSVAAFCCSLEPLGRFEMM